jgi:hypothetical protein
MGAGHILRNSCNNNLKKYYCCTQGGENNVLEKLIASVSYGLWTIDV